ncbi:MAG: hypothetical protein QXK37_03415 [Candidatus Woesearchaeota archaeon]
MNNKARWFIWFIALALALFISIFLARTFHFNPYVVDLIIGVIITTGALLHFHLSGNLKKYPIQTYTLVWKDSRYGDTSVYNEGLKSDMIFIPWDNIARVSVTSIDFRQGMTVVVFDKNERVYTLKILDRDGFKNAVASVSNFIIDSPAIANEA